MVIRDKQRGRKDGGKKWYVLIGNEKKGPLSTEELKKMAADGTLSPEDYVWKPGLADWVPAAKVKGLFPPAEKKPEQQQGHPCVQAGELKEPRWMTMLGLEVTSLTTWDCPTCDLRNAMGVCRQCKHKRWSWSEDRHGNRYLDCERCDSRITHVVCWHCQEQHRADKVLLPAWRRSFVKWGVYASLGLGLFFLFGGMIATVRLLSGERPSGPPSMHPMGIVFFTAFGGVLTWAALYSIRVTQNFTRWATLGWSQRCVPLILAVFVGSVVTVIVLMFLGFILHAMGREEGRKEALKELLTKEDRKTGFW